MANYREETNSQHTKRVARIDEARARAEAWVEEAAARGVPPNIIHAANYLTQEEAEAFRRAHFKTIQFFVKLRAYEKYAVAGNAEEQNLWNETVHEIDPETIPDAFDRTDLPPLEISLANLDQWEQAEVVEQSETVGLYETERRAEPHQIYLPLKGSWEVVKQLNQVCFKVGLDVNLPEPEMTGGPTERVEPSW